MPQTLSPSLHSHPLASQWIGFISETEVILMSGKVELGQGVSAALVQTLCSELGFAPEEVTLTAGDTLLSPDEGYTAGSQSIEVGVSAVQHVCAVIRSRYAEYAASQLKCKTHDLVLSKSQFHAPSGNLSLLSISTQIPLSTIRVDDPGVLLLNHPRPDSVNVKRSDLRTKFTDAGYIHDILLPDLWHARILRGPHPESKPINLNSNDLEELSGVDKVLIKNNFIALIGQNEEKIIQALEKAKKITNWSSPNNKVYDSIEEMFMSQTAQSSVVVDQKSPSNTLTNTEITSPHQTLTQRYSRPYIAHASIGLACAVAQYSKEDNRINLWSHSQGVFKLREQICKSLNLDLNQLRIIHSPGAGCYGHNGADDVAFDAALIAHELGITARVVWSRADELTHSPMGSASLVELSAQITNDGQITNWHAQVWSNTHLNRPGWGDGVNLLGYWSAFGEHLKPTPKDVPLPTGGGLRNVIPPYKLDALRVEHHFIEDSSVRVSALRSLGAHANVFAIESFMDELAEQIKMDPLSFRLLNIKDQRAKAVIERVADISNFKNRGEAGSSIGLGLAYSQYKNHAGHCAVVIQVEVTHKVNVQKIWVCVDAGNIIHKDGLLNQIEGGVIQSLSWTLKESVKWDESAITTSDWETYPILGFDEIPEIQIELIENSQNPSLGAGEVAAGPTAAALSNALSHALGVKFRHMPFTTDNVMKTLETSS